MSEELRAMDVRVAREVMGWTANGPQSAPPHIHFGKNDPYVDWSPSTDIAAAWSVVEAMRAKGWFAEIRAMAGWQGSHSTYRVTFWESTSAEPPIHTSYGVSMSRAVCLAALAALAKREGEK